MTMVAAGVASADLYVNWHADGGFVYGALGNLASPLITDGSGDSILMQLIFSATDTVDAAGNNSGNSFLTGDDQLLTSVIFTETDGVGGLEQYALFNETYTGAYLGAGYVYARIFQDDAPDAGDLYYSSGTIAAIDLDLTAEPSPNAQDLQVSYNPQTAGNSFDAPGSPATAGEVVPEPASISLLVLGAVVMGVRRRRS